MTERVHYVRNTFDLVRALVRVRAEASAAIQLTGAARITVKPADPLWAGVEPVKPAHPSAPELIAARSRT